MEKGKRNGVSYYRSIYVTLVALNDAMLKARRPMEITNTLQAIAAVSAPTPRFSPSLAPDEAKQQAIVLRALSDPTRLRIINLLSKYGGIIAVNEMETCFSLAQPTLSHHLKILREVGLVDCHKKGLYAYYYVVHAMLQRAKIIVESLTYNVEE